LALIGRVGVANAHLAYRRFTESMRSARWRALAEYGAHPQRLLWASTSVRNPAYPDTLHVDDSITGRFAEADDVLDTLASLGIDYHCVADRLERDGIRAFADSWDRLLEHLRRSMYALR
jgi:transaldolase